MKKLLLTCLVLLGIQVFGFSNSILDADMPGDNIINGNSIGTVTNSPQNSMELKQNFPNPFGSRTTILVNTIIEQKVEFKVYDMLGNLIIQRFIELEKGTNNLDFEREKLSQGLYFYSVDNGFQLLTKRMTIKD